MNRVDLVKEKFPDFVEPALKVEDPSGKHKYLLWTAQQLQKGYNSPDISSTVKFFHTNTSRFVEKDIYKYKDLKELEDIIKSIGLSATQEREELKKNATKIYEDDNFLCVRVDDKNAMMLYGANTKWCTTMRNYQYYEDYVCDGNEFYITIRKNEDASKAQKYAIVRKGFLDFEVYDEKDSHARTFDESERDRLRFVVQAIVVDKPPKNYIKMVCDKEIPTAEVLEWLKTQPESTVKFVTHRRRDIELIGKDTDSLIDFFL